MNGEQVQFCIVGEVMDSKGLWPLHCTMSMGIGRGLDINAEDANLVIWFHFPMTFYWSAIWIFKNKTRVVFETRKNPPVHTKRKQDCQTFEELCNKSEVTLASCLAGVAACATAVL